MKKTVNGQVIELNISEIIEFENSQLEEWSKSSHMAEINQLHDELFKSILSANNYIDMAELSLWAQQPDSLFRNEAIAIKAWYINTCEIICKYEIAVTEQTKVDAVEFINDLPKYGE